MKSQLGMMRSGRPLAEYRRLFATATVPLFVIFLSGCARYCVGPGPLFPPTIRTVYVPMFESDSFRRNLGEWLTEAVVKELEMRSPYKVVSNSDADSVLYCRILSDSKQAITEDINDNPRDIGTDLFVQMRWVDRSGQTVLRSAAIPIDVTLFGTAHLVPEGGQSMTTAQQHMIQSLARQIVAQMELGW